MQDVDCDLDLDLDNKKLNETENAVSQIIWYAKQEISFYVDRS